MVDEGLELLEGLLHFGILYIKFTRFCIFLYLMYKSIRNVTGYWGRGNVGDVTGSGYE